MSKIEKSIDVNVPVREAYNQWTQFESFPMFMDGVESVQQQGDTRLHWIAEIAGKRQEWDAEITEQTPDQRIAWTSTSGDRNAGAVNFHRLSDEKTRITLTMDVEPSGALEKVGDALGIPSGQVEGDLKRFKEFIESRGRATGAWRGEVEQNDVTGSDRSRELAGAGTMGSVGSSTDLGSDYGSSTSGTSSTGMDNYGSAGDANLGGAAGGLSGHTGDYTTGTDLGTTTGSTGRGEMGSGLNDPQDLGTGRRENETKY